jgi:hypothetical protein
MPIEDISRIITRIKLSPPERPISVFVVKKLGKKKLDAIYGNTIEAHKRASPTKFCPTCGHPVETPDEEWLGNFHNRMNMNTVRAFLTKALES